MELSHQAGAEAESLLRGQRSAVVVPHRDVGWDVEGEKAPFIRNEPVKLTPAWEGSNLPNDTLNLKGVVPIVPPEDTHSMIFLTLILHGLGTLTAWNMFITAKDYFVEYKLKDSDYANNYLVYVGYASQLPNFLFSWFNVFADIGGDLTLRIVVSLMMEVAIFVLTIVLAMADSSQWPEAFFWITMVSIFMLNACNAVFQNSVFGVAARLPPKYTGAVILGTNVCGTTVVLLNWLTSSSGNLRTSAIYYFIGGMFVLLICFDTYFALPLNKFYRYHDAKAQAASATRRREATGTPYLEILRDCWVQLYNIWMVFFVTLSIFPAVHSDISSESGFLGADFVRITCFLTFNLSAMLGCITASLVQIPSPEWLAAFTTIRLVFIPLFLMCNYHPKGVARTLGVVIPWDWLYWTLAWVMGWSSGHASSLGMMYVSREVEPQYASKAGMLGGAMLVTGILSGIAFSALGPIIVSAGFWKSV